MTDQTLIDLESRIAFQEKAIEDLREAFYAQQDVVLRLEADNKRLSDQVKALLQGGEPIGPANEKPPHY